MPRTESNMNVNGRSENVRRMRHEQSDEPIREQDELLDEVDEDYGRSWESGGRDEPRPFVAQSEFQEEFGEQAEFREHFDEDLYNDREEAPVQGNTADVAMGEQRFGSDAEAYTEYAHRRPGEDSAVGQSRDLSDISNEDNEEQP
jgi:hypothetical protein